MSHQLDNAKNLYLCGIRDGEIKEVMPDKKALTNLGSFRRKKMSRQKFSVCFLLSQAHFFFFGKVCYNGRIIYGKGLFLHEFL